MCRRIIATCRLASALAAALAAAIAIPAGAQSAGRHDVEVTADGRVIVDGRAFGSWLDYVRSDYFREGGFRCGTLDPRVEDDAGALGAVGGPADCALGFTNPDPVYDPSVVKYFIPVVVHVLHKPDGTGLLDAATIHSQIDVLNEDFLALPGTNGGPGTDIQIEFFLATVDPAGDPASGITYTENTNWFNDSGDYWTTLAWDTSRYLNIYTNTAAGFLGYVPGLPQEGSPGNTWDRVVVNYEAFGRPSPLFPFDLGRTATHEVGHYLGLYHVFAGCGTSACNSTGDLCCDTGAQSSPNFGCGDGGTCSEPDSFHNYLDYVDDLCMDNFSPEQARRMRCTLEHWRPDLGLLAPSCPDPPVIDCNGNCVLDDDEIADGTAPDCNGNGVPDSCDVGGPSTDCNNNGVPDECEDCNGNGIADSCEYTATYDATSGARGPIGLGAPVTHLFADVPDASSAVTLIFDAVADIGSRFQTLDAYLHDAPVGTLYGDGAFLDCASPPARDQLVVSSIEFNSLIDAAGGDATIRVETFDGVDPSLCAGSSSIEITLQYDAVPDVLDTNDNGVPDECDLARGDGNLDGVVNVTDLLALLAAWGPCPGDCPQDTNFDDVVNVTDLLNLLGGWG